MFMKCRTKYSSGAVIKFESHVAMIDTPVTNLLFTVELHQQQVYSAVTDVKGYSP